MDGSLAERLQADGPPPSQSARLAGEALHRAGPTAPPDTEIVVRRTKPKHRRGPDAPTRQATLRPPMQKFVIEGGVPLSGTIVPAGNKNGALPILAACLLTDDEVILRNVPRIRDVEAMTLLLEQLGARIEWRGPGEISIDCSSVDSCEVDQELA